MPRLLPIIVLLLVALQLVGCGEDPAPPRQVARWECPATWVVYERGGCGPAVLLCVPGGGAAPGACEGVDLSRPLMIALPDGGTVRGFYRLPDGGIGGGWPEPGDPDGPPSEGWVPDAGIATCAEGWRRLPDGTCDPMLRTDCPEGSGALPGGRCTPTALSDCPAGEYADSGTEAAGQIVVHVRAGADPAVADGSVAHPYATIAAGVQRVGRRGWVLVAAGGYPEQFHVGGGTTVHVLGVCAARVVLRGPGATGSAFATVSVGGTRAVLDLRGVTVHGETRGLEVYRRGMLRTWGVVVGDNVDYGVLANGVGTVVELASSVVRGTRHRSDSTGGKGIEAQEGAVVRATDVLVSDNAEVGVGAFGVGTAVELTSSVIRGTHSRTDDGGGFGLFAALGAVLRATGVLVADNTQVGVVATAAGTVLELASSIVRGTHPRRDGTAGRGITAQEGALLRATSVLIADNAERGVIADGAGTELEIASSVVRSTNPYTDGTFGRGIEGRGGAVVRATGVLVVDNAEVGVGATGTGTVLELASSIVRGTHPRRDGTSGRGITAQEGALLRATGVLISENTEVGVGALGAGTVLELASSVVRGTHRRPNGTRGHGIGVVSGAILRVTGLLVADNAEVGVHVIEGRAELSHLLVMGVAPSRIGLGAGIFTLGDALVVASQVALQTVSGAGFVSLQSRNSNGARFTAWDVFVREVRSSTVLVREDGPTTQPTGRTVAYGLHTGPGCTIEATRAVLDTGGFGFFNASGTITLHQGVISRQSDAMGAVDLATPDSAITLNGVSFLDNATDTVTRRADLPTASELPSPTRSE